MRSIATPTTPGDIDISITLTAKLSEWTRLEKQLSEDWPASDVSRIIRSTIRQCTQAFSPIEEPKDV